MNDEIMRETAKSCKDCLGWLPICQAICCRGFILTKKGGWKVKKGDIVRVGGTKPNMKRYYELHGARVDRGILSVKLNDFEVNGELLDVLNKCSLLGDNLKCKGHPDDYPQICKDYTEEKYGSKGYFNFPVCLYRFKKEAKQ